MPCSWKEIEDQANEVKHEVTMENMVEAIENEMALGEVSPGEKEVQHTGNMWIRG